MTRIAIIFLIALLGYASAQLSGEAQNALEQARALAAEAKEQYAGTIYNPDQPLWREALTAGNRALEMAPDSPEVLRFLAETYSTLRWYVRAWDFWLRYLDAGGNFDVEAQAQLADSGNELGYARYEAQDFASALSYYQQVSNLLPENSEALTWLGRINFELGDPAAALPYWQALVALNPDDEAAQYYLERSEQQLEVGLAASDAFYQGLSLYDNKQLEEALSAFEQATETNPEFTEAFVWAGRISIELGRPAAAQAYWQRVLELKPDDERARYFLDLAQKQLSWGVEAANAFEAGIVLYEEGNLAEAALAFEEAVRRNPRYKDAAVWAARSYQESGKPERAIFYWEQVLNLDPDDKRASYFLDLAQDQVSFGVEAASSFRQGLENYQLAQFDEARSFFVQATEENPDYAAAWAWRGRLAFDLADYKEATTSYERALELEPDNEAYRFFAEEAARLLAAEDENDLP